MAYRLVQVGNRGGLDIKFGDGHRIGEGSYGSVYLIPPYKKFVVKLPHSDEQVSGIHTEILIGEKLGPHPNIAGVTQARALCPDETMCLVMKYAGKPLGDILHGNCTGSIRMVRDRATVALFNTNMHDALAFIQRHKTTHGDIHPGNILYQGDRASDTACFTLIDFGLAKEDLSGVLYDIRCTRDVFSILYKHVYGQQCPVISNEDIAKEGMQIFDVFQRRNDEKDCADKTAWETRCRATDTGSESARKRKREEGAEELPVHQT